MAISRTPECHKLQTKEKQLQDQIRKRNTKQERRQKIERDAEDTMSSSKLFQTFGAATGNALLS